MTDTIKNVLMKRDGLSEQEADKRVALAKQRLHEEIIKGNMPFDFCEEEFGLEPDYLEELL